MGVEFWKYLFEEMVFWAKPDTMEGFSQSQQRAGEIG